jgi:hypothetical protein
MLPDPKIRCPATGFDRTCREIIAECDCPKFVKIAGTDPNTGVHIDKMGCVDSFLPMLLIENAKESRQTGAAVESFRNNVSKVAGALLQVAVANRRDAIAGPGK